MAKNHSKVIEPVIEPDVKPVVEEVKVPVIEPVVKPVVEPIVKEIKVKPKNNRDKLKDKVNCPDCDKEVTVHGLRYTHAKYCKAVNKPKPEQAPPISKITDISQPVFESQPTEEQITNYLLMLKQQRANVKRYKMSSLVSKGLPQYILKKQYIFFVFNIKMASYEQQAEVLSKLNAFSDRNKTNFNKRDAVLHEINRHRENQASSIKFRKNVLENQKTN